MDSVPKIRISGGHLNIDSTSNFGLKQLFTTETFDEIEEDRQNAVYLDADRIKQLVTDHPDRRLFLFDLINQENTTIATAIKNEHFILSRKSAISPKTDELLNEIKTREEKLRKLEALKKSQQTAMEEIQALIQQDEIITLGQERKVGESFYNFLDNPRDRK